MVPHYFCRGPTWRSDDLSRCFHRNYLETLFPLIVCGVSLLYLSIQIAIVVRAKRRAGYKPLNTDASTWDIRGAYDGAEESRYRDEDTEDEGEGDERPSLGLHPTKTHESMIEVNKPRGELFLTMLEEAAVLGEVGMHLTILVANVWKHGHVAAIAQLATWSYVAALASMRLLLSASSRFSFPRLWYHTCFIYCALWVFTTLVFRSALIHPRSKLSQNLTIADFALSSLLAVIALTSRKGNKAVKLEYEGGLEPSKEQTASVLSLATFGWVDAIVWQGYIKTFQITDVWNLAPRDKAAALLADYRQVKKTSSLAFHLLGYFKRGLIIQAAWAVISGFLTFAPTLLLKAILEYVESPETTPKNAAWFFVILLFVSGCASALADGQALWIGRKICLRLRAVIIGEIYAKALKRKASAAADKVLGVDKSGDTQNPGLFQRIMSFGRKKKEVKPKEETKPEEEEQVTSGTIINLMAVDSFKVSEICAYLHFLWASTPVQFIMAIALLYRILGYSSIAGIGMMALLLPVNMVIAKMFSKIQKQILAATDARIHTTNEVLSNIRIIKFFAWEQRFMGLVNEKRATELMYLRRRYILWATAATVWSGAPILITFLSFLVYTKIEKKELIPSVAFTALSLFQILRIPLDQLADMVAHVQESKVSVDRIEEFLNEPDTEKYIQLRHPNENDSAHPLIGFENGQFTWGGRGEGDESFKLRDLDIEFRPNQLNVIVGPTGSGKTSMLMALLGEMTLLHGNVYLPGWLSREDLKPEPQTGLIESVAYCAQQAWLVNASIKENIIFASPFDAKRYKDVLIACSLQRDLEILDHGDKTLVGEKGVTLSGGQKQRISLARALYSRARHVLLDDVLSAVDSHTAKWIFDQALLGPLMYNRTCILVTHNVALCVPHAEFSVVLENGRVVAQGSPSEVIDSGKLGEDLSKSRPVSRGPSRVASRVPSDVGGEEALGETLTEEASNGHAIGVPLAPTLTMGGKPEVNELEETKAEGAVKLSIIVLYLKAMGSWPYWALAALTFTAQQLASVATNVWIRQWANAYVKTSEATMQVQHASSVTHVGTFSGLGTCLTSGTCNWAFPISTNSSPRISITSHGDAEVDSTYYLSVYAVIGVGFMVITLFREAVLFGGSLTASRRVHQRLMESVAHAKFRFFDTTPLGQIMNRFSKDIESIDQEVAPVAVGVVHCLFSIITIVILISVITPGFLIAGAFISILYFLIGKFYINSSRDLKRLESLQRSPLYQQFGETLSGMTTIRAYGDERRFIRENYAKVNTHNRPFIYLWAANRWLAFRVDVVGALVAFFAGVFVVLSVGKIDPGAAGLAMTYAVSFTENVLWFVRLYASNEQNMNSVERIKEYLDVEQEAKTIVEENRPPGNWPSKGSVEFNGYSTRYRTDFDLVLKKLTFKILPGEKVGVVGRTGAGKSSMALALFRALEAEEGKILVDDIDIGLIGLQDLRENIVMVPQDPTLFTGTIRSNLDPFNLFTDKEIFTALRRVQLIGSPTSTRPGTPAAKGTASSVASSPSKNISWSTSTDATLVDGGSPNPQAENKNVFLNLSSPISDSGSNLSQGQRQLLCLARALIKDPKVLLMDEATASIDYATDAKIQETIREIKNTTITIAHRLQTIIDYDKVLVLDKGEVVEYGSPLELVNKEGGVFGGMVDMTGEGDMLRSLAKKADEAKRSTD
ncbi:bile acid-transporting ATPase [Tothia fuscella]|uniref:Bile acid-transporting ATPase n=1 Tax=Tothia fuscella TaxID=1048955 RepID=A0A9P4U1H5_9PEZI|nr:bile acid-transporting ATPase [Tothia fuscella]